MFSLKQILPCILGLASLASVTASPVAEPNLPGVARDALVDSSAIYTRAADVVAQGPIRLVGLEQFVVTFDISPHRYEFTANTDQELGPILNSNPTATLTYTNTFQLVGLRGFSGTQGPNNGKINLDNGPSIVWNIEGTPTGSLSGSGTWRQVY